MVTKPSVNTFFQQLAQSGLLKDETIDSFRSLPGDRVVYHMIEQGVLTDFQARQLVAGRFRGFFIGEKYKILDALGKGGMGRVFLCEHLMLQRLVAVKLMYSSRENHPGAIERFMQEARASAKFDHPNLARVFDVDMSPVGPYIVMEYIDGKDLHSFVASHGAVAPTQAAHYIRQAALGLEQAHRAGLVHRDIKPGNLMLDRTGTIKLLDLGLARCFDNGPADRGLTAQFDPNAILGTADFIAPEQALESSRADIRADIYSLGCTFYFLLIRALPAGSGTTMQKLLRHQSKEPTPILEIRSDVPEAMVAIIERMMKKDPAERFQTPTEVVEALTPFTSTPIPPPPPDQMPPPRLANYRLGITASNGPRTPSSPVQKINKPSSAPLSAARVTASLSSEMQSTAFDPPGLKAASGILLAPMPSKDQSSTGSLFSLEGGTKLYQFLGIGTVATLVILGLALTWRSLWGPATPAKPTLVASVSGNPSGDPAPAAGENPNGAPAADRMPVAVLRGGGSSFVKPIMDHWVQIYEHHSGRRVEYTSAGSSRGVEGVIAQFLDFGCSDAPLTDAQIADTQGKILHVPLVMGAVVPTYNLTDAQGEPLRMQFTGPLLANIYLGKVTKWNDPSIAANNPGVTLPDLDITVVSRKDGSGTTNIWTDYLSKASAAWKTQVGVGNAVPWPVGVQGEKNNGVADVVSRTTGAIGYVELSYAIANNLAHGAVRNRQGTYVTASVESITAAAAGSIQAIPADFRYSVTDSPGPNAFPIVGTCWGLFHVDLVSQKREEVLNFMTWAIGDGQRYLAAMHYGALPPELVPRILESIQKAR